ncbi:LexA family transcriptional regulator [Sphingomonas sp. NY01]|uniref:LexA family transcriptional regulator n=1 Tax=Sphingomonas sp. NY01 TaxID=2968057 RepID=UPI00315D970D
MRLPHKSSVDKEWFKTRKREVKASDEKLAAAIGRDRTTVTKVINGDVRFDLTFADGFARVLQVSTSEILRRVGLDIPEQAPADASPNADTPPAFNPSASRTHVVADLPAIRDASAGDGAIAVRRVDLSYAMGDGTTLEDYPEEEAVLFDPGFLRRISRAPAHCLFVAQGEGDSMFPTLINDDEVVIDTTQKVLNMQDRIWACAYRGAGMIKRLRIVGEGQVEIRSDNKTVGDQVVDADDLVIVGRVIWVGRRV